MKTIIRSAIEASIQAKQACLEGELCRQIEDMAAVCIHALKEGGKLLIFGNGGSASDALHIAAELVGRYRKERVPLSAIALPANVSDLTALGNDYGFDHVFSRQITALGRAGDIAIGISTSGNSQNVYKALETAHALGLACYAWTGGKKGHLDALPVTVLSAPATDTARIQECHILIGHILCECIDSAYQETR